MNQASFFIEKKALFGGFPNHNQIEELVDEGVVWFVDLTHRTEKNIKVYSHLVTNWINFPIKDGQVPENNKNFFIFLLVIQMVLESLKPGEKIYLHCRGGHGRSSLVASCILGMVLKIPPFESMSVVRRYHSRRPNLRSKWLSRWPLNRKQRKFIEAFFGSTNLYFKNLPWFEPKTKIDFLRYMTAINLYLMNFDKPMLETLLNSGLKTIVPQGPFTWRDGSNESISVILRELRLYILYSKAKKIFESLKAENIIFVEDGSFIL